MSEHFTGFTFDAAGVNYTYDGDGDRVQKSNGKIYWYGAGTEILDETDLTGSTTNSSFNEYIYFGGERVARRDYQSNVFYYFSDQVGSSRGIAEVTHGGTSATLCYDADFFPFGGEHDYTNTCPQNYKFTGKERDPETNNDDFGARYYSSTYGRFLSADWSAVPAPVPYANLTNPQTLNLYAIVNDNPESFADLDGHLPAFGSENCGSNGSCGSDPNESANVSSINTGTAQVNQTQNTAAAQNEKTDCKCGTVGHYKTANKAATAALNKAFGKSEKEHVEYGGRVYKNSDGTYSYTTAVTQKRANDVNVDDGATEGSRIPAETTNAGIYHTHETSAGYNPEQFSYADVGHAVHEHVPNYIETPSGLIHEVDGTHATSIFTAPQSTWPAAGPIP